MQKIVDQVNNRFDFLNKRIDTLEKQLEEATKPKRTSSVKKVEETT